MTSLHNPSRYRLRRAGVFNVWQYDEQVFDIEGGRLLLRGTNGAGKSKTLEMLLPFVLDGDKGRLTASGRHHTSLLWLMLDGYDGSSRTGYLWVEFEREDDEGHVEWFTCGVGLRASQSARAATSWYFTTTRRIGHDLQLEDDGGVLSRPRLAEELGEDGHVFESGPRYKGHVGRTLFGLDPARYDDLLRLLYWLRQPQVGEDIDPGRLADQLSQALPQVDDEAIRAAGDTFDELAAFGEQIARKEQAASAVASFAETYRRYAAGVVVDRATAVLEADAGLARRAADRDRAGLELDEATAAVTQAEEGLRDVGGSLRALEARRRELERSPEARSQQRLLILREVVESRADALQRAGRVAEQAQARAERSRRSADSAAERLGRRATEDVSRLAATSTAMAGTGFERGLPVPELPTLAGRHEADVVNGLAEQVRDTVREATAELSRLTAAVQVVQDAQTEHTGARAQAQEAERLHAAAEQRAERAAERAAESRRLAHEAERQLIEQLRHWRAAAPEIDFDPPELTAETLPELPASARAAAAPAREAASLAAAEAHTRIDSLTAERTRVAEQRARMAAESDPAPPAPHWLRDDRSGLVGGPLWRVVDFREDVDDATRAAVEAALEASGLLDAWVLPSGELLDSSCNDVVLSAGEPITGATLAAVLAPDAPDDAGLSQELVERLLHRVAWNRADVAAVSADGSWSLGPLHGRATKPVTQYVGATARAQERARRLAELDQRLAQLEELLGAAEAALAESRGRMAAIEAWVDGVPRHEKLLAAWTTLEVRGEEAESSRHAADDAGRAAEAARAVAARLLAQLEQLAATHGLPTTSDGLASRREKLNDIAGRLEDHDRRWQQVTEETDRWLTELETADGDRVELDERETERAQAEERHRTAAAELGEAVAVVGAGVAELERRLREVQEETASGRRRQEELGSAERAAINRQGAAEQGLRAAEQRHAEAREPVRRSAADFAALADVPGLLEAALRAQAVDAERRAAVHTVGALPDDGLGRAAKAEVRRCREAAAAEKPVDRNRVLAAWAELESSAAADLQPRIFEVGDVYVVAGRDDSGELPVALLALRLRAAVEADRQLLTDRERRLFEDHVLGHLGETLRERRREADDLVRAMNQLLDGVATSQGIRVRLRWRLRDDIAPEARRAVELLGERVEALLAGERAELRDSLHRLIEASRAEAPEESYSEHLARALDYRRWFAFRVRYLRPETPDSWLDLHRRSPLSQGEQKVVCYLPLFAAAAAHFHSIAGAAPHSPRIVLLDDAFPKIDARTHPLLFGLLVDFDLDFVVTSERLWGDHDTVPSLSIYETLRDPAQRGIAQFFHRWDGRRLHAIGA